MANRATTNFITGLFILLVAGALGGLAFYLQDTKPVKSGNRYLLIFDEAPGISERSPVMIGGKVVGAVETVQLEQQAIRDGEGQRLATQAVIGIVIDPLLSEGIEVYTNASAGIVTSLFRGSSIAIYPGGSGVGGQSRPEKLQPGSRIRGATPGSFDDVTTEGREALKAVRVVLDDLHVMLGDDAMRQKVAATIEQIAATGAEMSDSLRELAPELKKIGLVLEDARAIAQNVRAMVEENRANVGAAVENAQKLTARANDLMIRIESTAASLETAAGEVATLAGTASETLDDGRFAVGEILANARDASGYLRDLAEKLRRDPSIIIWGTDAADNAADRKAGARTTLADEFKLRESGRLPPRERD